MGQNSVAIHPPNKQKNLNQDCLDLMRRGIGEMNMKRSLILSLCAVVLAAIGMSAAQAATDAALNLRYINPADTSAGPVGLTPRKANRTSR